MVSYISFRNVKWDFKDLVVSGSVWDDKAEAPLRNASIDVVLSGVRDDQSFKEVVINDRADSHGVFDIDFGDVVEYREWPSLGVQNMYVYLVANGVTASGRIPFQTVMAQQGISETKEYTFSDRTSDAGYTNESSVTKGTGQPVMKHAYARPSEIKKRETPEKVDTSKAYMTETGASFALGSLVVMGLIFVIAIIVFR